MPPPKLKLNELSSNSSGFCELRQRISTFGAGGFSFELTKIKIAFDPSNSRFKLLTRPVLTGGQPRAQPKEAGFQGVQIEDLASCRLGSPCRSGLGHISLGRQRDSQRLTAGLNRAVCACRVSVFVKQDSAETQNAKSA